MVYMITVWDVHGYTHKKNHLLPRRRGPPQRIPPNDLMEGAEIDAQLRDTSSI